MEMQGKTVVCLATDSRLRGVLGIADLVRPEACTAVAALKAMNIDVWMMTGDNQTTAEVIAESVGIPRDRVLANLLPPHKLDNIRDLQERLSSSSSSSSSSSATGKVAMVGDGINDAPALAQADVGFAVGSGTRVAVESADLVLIRNNLCDVPVAIDLARVVFARVKLNFLWAVVYNFLAIPFAAGAWFPYSHMIMPPQYAGLLMAVSSLSVIMSSLGLNKYKRPRFAERDAEAAVAVHDDSSSSSSSSTPSKLRRNHETSKLSVYCH